MIFCDVFSHAHLRRAVWESNVVKATFLNCTHSTINFVWASSENGNKGEWMNQASCASKNGTCARLTKPHSKSHAQHKPRPFNRSFNHLRHQPYGQLTAIVTAESPKHGTHGRNEKKKQFKTRLDKRNALSVCYDRGSNLGMFKNNVSSWKFYNYSPTEIILSCHFCSI